MISCPDVRKDVIRQHYNISTLFYWLLWGRHIHHGYWEANEAPQVAAQQLTERLALAAGIQTLAVAWVVRRCTLRNIRAAL